MEFLASTQELDTKVVFGYLIMGSGNWTPHAIFLMLGLSKLGYFGENLRSFDNLIKNFFALRPLPRGPWRFFFLQYNWLQLDKTENKWKIFYKEITKKETWKYSTSTYLTALSNRTVKKESGGRTRSPC